MKKDTLFEKKMMDVATSNQSKRYTKWRKGMPEATKTRSTHQ